MITRGLYHEAGFAGYPGKFQFSLRFRYHERGLAFSRVHCRSNLHSTANLLRAGYVLV